MSGRLRAVAALVPLLAGLAPGSAGAYRLDREALSGGVLAAAQPALRIGATVGEAGIVGRVGGGSFLLSQGFWLPTSGVPVGVAEIVSDGAPARHALRTPVPNPFAAAARIPFEVAARSPVSVTIFDVAGRLVRGVLEATLDAGRYAVTWDGRDAGGRRVASAVYYVRFEAGGYARTRPLLLLR